MSDAPLNAQIDAAHAYESLFVPALFHEWPSRIADAMQIRSGQRALDVGCGTGVLARELAARVGSPALVVGLDRSEGMLSVAKEFAPEIEWRLGTAESLPFADSSFDAVANQFALMFFDDRHAAICEMLRVLTSGGKLGLAVWDALANNPAFEREVALLERMAGSEAAAALRAPFVLGDRDVLRALFAEVGVTAEIHSHEGKARFPSIRTMVEADLRGWLPMMGVVLTEDLIGDVLNAAERSLTEYIAADGRAEFAVSALLATATKH